MIFIDNKYTNIYYRIINAAKSRKLDGYKEVHHIVPRSFGGDNSKDNLVSLTAREHYLVHWLLIKMTIGVHRSKMIYAFWRMNTNRKYKVTSRTYEMIKQENSKNHSERMFGKNNPFYGKQHSPEMIEKIKQRNRQQKWSEERHINWKGKLSGENNPMFGRTHTQETKDKISAINTGRKLSQDHKDQISKCFKGKLPKVAGRTTTCPHCNKILDLGNAARHHFDNCKMNPAYTPKPKRTYNIKH